MVKEIIFPRDFHILGLLLNAIQSQRTSDSELLQFFLEEKGLEVKLKFFKKLTKADYYYSKKYVKEGFEFQIVFSRTTIIELNETPCLSINKIKVKF